MAVPEVASGRVLSIHYLRAVAAIMVVIYHVFSHRLVAVENPETIAWLQQGVGIFFVISGFVMVTSTSTGSCSPHQFLQRRFQRVVPLYWLATLCFALCSAERDWRYLLGSLFFIPTSDPATSAIRQPVLHVGWTLNYEMAFYTLFALAMLLPRRATIWAMCLVLVILSCLPGIFELGPLFGYYLQPVLLDFVAGMVLARLGLRAPAWCMVLGFVLLAIMPQFVDWRVLTVTLPAALIVASARSLDGSLREWPIPVLLGDASYAIYLSHLFVVIAIVGVLGTSGNPAMVLALSVFGSIAVGVIIHFYIEVPFATLFRHRRTLVGAGQDNVRTA